jgi:acyl carrier protein
MVASHEEAGLTADRERLLEELEDLLVNEYLVERESITPQAHLLEDLMLDSLDLMSAVAILEERYGLSIPDEQLVEMVTVEKCLDRLVAHLEERA